MTETEFLRKCVNEWKNKVGASYKDVAESIGLKSRSFMYEFLKGKKDVSYETGKRLEKLIMITKEEWEKL